MEEAGGLSDCEQGCGGAVVHILYLLSGLDFFSAACHFYIFCHKREGWNNLSYLEKRLSKGNIIDLDIVPVR
jgi:hypothetical protein